MPSFRKKRLLNCDGNFYISFTCKNDPAPPIALTSNRRLCGLMKFRNSTRFLCNKTCKIQKHISPPQSNFVSPLKP